MMGHIGCLYFKFKVREWLAFTRCGRGRLIRNIHFDRLVSACNGKRLARTPMLLLGAAAVRCKADALSILCHVCSCLDRYIYVFMSDEHINHAGDGTGRARQSGMHLAE